MHTEPVAFGVRLRRLRELAGLTQEELAERAGLTAQGVSALERGHRKRPYPHTVRALIDALGGSDDVRTALFVTNPTVRPAPPQVWLQSNETSQAQTNLPRNLTSFVGRADDLADIAARLVNARLLTLVGSGGIGKTRLAIALGTRIVGEYTHGVWFVDLSSALEPASVAQAAVAALPVANETDATHIEVLSRYLNSRCVLLVLDNCEHQIDACAELANALLQTTSEVTILATSRQPLRVPGEVVWRVPPLVTSAARAAQEGQLQKQTAAAQLFAERAAAAAADFHISDQNRDAIERICRALDGIPLAIELAAARAGGLGVEGIADRMADLPRLLTAGSRVAPRRQRTISATIDWSYDLLTQPEQHLFARLSVFSGGFTLEAAEAVASGLEPDVIELLPELVEKSMVQVDAESKTGRRYRMLQTLREYASKRLGQQGDLNMAKEAHARYFLNLAERNQALWHSRARRSWLQRLELEHDNFRAALAWSSTNDVDQIQLRLGAALWWFWIGSNYRREGLAWLEAALATPSPTPRSVVRANALHGAAMLSIHLGDFQAFGTWLAEAADLAREFDLALPILALATVMTQQGEYDTAEALFDEALTVARQASDTWAEGLAVRWWADLELARGDYSRARAKLELCLRLLDKHGDMWSVALAINSLGDLERRAGQYDRAAELYSESLALLEEFGGDATTTSVLQNLAYAELRQGNERAAAALFTDCLSTFNECGDQRGVAECLVGLGGLMHAIGDHSFGVKLFSVGHLMAQHLGAELSPMCKLEYARDVDATRVDLSDAEFAAAWQSGTVATVSGAIADVKAILQRVAVTPAPGRRVSVQHAPRNDVV